MSESLASFFKDFPAWKPEEIKLITDAYDLMATAKKDSARGCGESYMQHPLRVAGILAALGLDADTIVCALLHGSLEDLPLTEGEIEERFGKAVFQMLQGTSRISGVKLQNKNVHQAESIRKMFFAMVDDIRVILVRLADRLDKMRTLKHFTSENQKLIAQETLDIWAPLANRLGISSLKDELEDLSLKYTNREAFDQIKTLVALKKGERSDYLEKAEKEILKAAHRAGIEVQVKSRAKHFYSIYQKIKKRNKAVDELYDLLALRIMTNSVNECYTALGLVHTIWKPLDGRFKDYIAMPKANGYQSLHTTVMCYGGQPLEIQIRTQDMHQIAENGIASHWLYKKGKSRDSVKADDLSIINQLRELAKNGFTDEDFLARIKTDLLGDSIYVFTPKGDIIELPSGSTAIDFAYHIHSAVGEKIVGAKADNSIIPLSQELRNTQVVEVLTHPQAHPTVNQFKAARTAKARQKIRAWLQANDSGAIADKKETAPETVSPAQKQHGHQKGIGQETFEAAPPEFNSAVLKIKVGETTNFLFKFANCCRPVPPTAITGYVSRGRGIIIHRSDCTNLARIPEISMRNISVEWELPEAKEKPAQRKKKSPRPAHSSKSDE